MSPRPYESAQRRADSDKTRGRIVAAAREQLASGRDYGDFTVDSVARKAGVARMTVYYQFGSKSGLLEAVCDDMALRGGMQHMRDPFVQADPREGLRVLIGVLAAFYAADRPLMRRLHGLAALDPELAQVIEARNQRRREALRVLLGRLREAEGRPAEASLQPELDLLHTLTSFETFDALAGSQRSPDAVVALQAQLAAAVLAPKRD
jgi:AcrR family transcriptional regulator